MSNFIFTMHYRVDELRFATGLFDIDSHHFESFTGHASILHPPAFLSAMIHRIAIEAAKRYHLATLYSSMS